jgi:transcriptional regulator with XRE-family HTH domain
MQNQLTDQHARVRQALLEELDEPWIQEHLDDGCQVCTEFATMLKAVDGLAASIEIPTLPSSLVEKILPSGLSAADVEAVLKANGMRREAATWRERAALQQGGRLVKLAAPAIPKSRRQAESARSQTESAGGTARSRSTSFGDLLRSLRHAANLSQEELAQRAHLSVKAVGALERGERLRPYPNTVRALAEALGASSEARTALMDSAARRDAGSGDSGGDASPARPAPVERAVPLTPTEAEQQAAAWEIYVELVTRTAVVELGDGQGTLREALASLHSLFGAIRAILRQHGPAVARAAGSEASEVSVLAMAILNDVLRPLLADWHPELLVHESRCPDGLSAAEHERAWARHDEMRDALAQARGRLGDYARLLAAAAGVPHPLMSNRARLTARLSPAPSQWPDLHRRRQLVGGEGPGAS